MMSSWLFMWMAFMFLFILFPVGYGWGYRGWGPPYPRYLQRRRAEQALGTGRSGTFDHHAWGWRGDLMWVVLSLGIFWGILVLVWLR